MGLSTKPYLIRAIHEWCTDNGYRPYIAVAVDEHTIVPREFVRNGEIVLNVSAMATNRLQIGNELVEFEARFGGTPRQGSIPVENISAIFAQENGHGMAFEVPKALALAPSEAQPLGGDEADDDGAAASGQGGDSAPAKAKRGSAADGAAGPIPLRLYRPLSAFGTIANQGVHDAFPELKHAPYTAIIESALS
mgnify:CR=1 FL=1